MIKLLAQEGIKHNFVDGKGGLLTPDNEGDPAVDILLRHTFRHQELVGCDVVRFLFGTEYPLLQLNDKFTCHMLHKAVQFECNTPTVKLLLELNPSVLVRQKNELGDLPIHSTVTMYPQLSSTNNKHPPLITICNEIIKPKMLNILI